MVSVKRFKQIKMIRDKHCTHRPSESLLKSTLKSYNKVEQLGNKI